MKHTAFITKWPNRILATVALAFLMLPLAAFLLPAASGGIIGVASAADCPSGYVKVESGATAKDRKPVCLPSSRDFVVKAECKEGACIFKKYINPAINVASMAVGLVCTGSYVLAGIQYASSANNSQKVSASKQRIVTTTFVLVGYFMLYAGLNWAIPGGLVNL